MRTLGERVREIRGDLTQAEIAARLSVQKNMVSKWEHDETFPDFETLQKIIVEYELSPEWLMLGAGAKHAPPLKDFGSRTVPATMYFELVNKWNERVEIHREKLEEIASLKETANKAVNELMALNAENRELRRIEKVYKEYFYAAAVRGLGMPEKEYKEYLTAASDQVFKQLAENPGLGAPADPDVADYMGAFEEHAVSADDIIDNPEAGIPVDPDVADYKEAFVEQDISIDEIIEDDSSGSKK